MWAQIDARILPGNIDKRTRNLILSEQIDSIVQMTPALSCGAMVISFHLLAVSVGTPHLSAVTIWVLTMLVLVGFGVRSWFRIKTGKSGRRNPEKAARHAIAGAGIVGATWAILPSLMLPAATPTIQVMVPVAMAAVILSAAVSYSPLPQAALMFLLPVIIGCLFGARLIDTPLLSNLLTIMLLTLIPIILTIVIRTGRSLTMHVKREVDSRAQKNVISLLLREFEENSSDWLWEFCADGRIDRVSDRFSMATEMSKAELIDKDFIAFLRSLADGEEFDIDEIAAAISKRETFNGVELDLNLGGREVVWRLTGKAVYDQNGNYSGYIGTASDVTAEKTAEKKINYLAHYDALTGLVNRARFTEMLGQCVSRLERYGTPFSVFYLDLDRFKLINDSSGHLVGDKLLIEVAKRVRAEVRESDIVARLGGDEFAILLPNLSDSSEASSLAQRLVSSIEKPFEIDTETLSIGLSLGIAIAPINGTRPDQLLRNADLALYRAKEEGRGMFRFFEAEMDSSARERRMLEVELRQALTDGEFVLYYQPLVAAEDGVPTGFEALLRWDHPIRGIVPPAEFIPIAEQSGLIREIGDWTIREACRAASTWPDEMTVAVNLSPKHFLLSDIEKVARDALAETELRPNRLELEITESLLIDRSEEVMDKLGKLKDLGVTIAMDDFGTGYSSLSYLLKFPFDKIKIDRSFVDALTTDPAARDILRSIVALGKTLKMNITAEGVENSEQASFLKDVACNHFQGFLFSKPMSSKDIGGYLLSGYRDKVLRTDTSVIEITGKARKSA